MNLIYSLPERFICNKRILTCILIIISSIDLSGQSFDNQSHWQGRELFKNKGCILCHSIRGQGGTEGPDLSESKFYGTRLELAALMWNHIPEMLNKMHESDIRYPEITSAEMMNIIDYLCFMRYKGEKGSEFTGRKLLKSKGCIFCHKFGTEGGDIGPNISEKKEYISPIMLVEAMWNHGPKMKAIFRKNNIDRPNFEGNDIINIAEAIKSYMSPTKIIPGSFAVGDPQRGKELTEKKGCMYCHSFRGTGGESGPDFDDVDMNYSVIEIAGKMWNHEPNMWDAANEKGIAFPVFESGEMADVVAYIYELKLTDKPGNGDRGLETLTQQGCLKCHSINGKGGDIATDLAEMDVINSPLDMVSAMWNHAPDMKEEIIENKRDWPKLNAEEMSNIFTYLNTFSAK